MLSSTSLQFSFLHFHLPPQLPPTTPPSLICPNLKTHFLPNNFILPNPYFTHKHHLHRHGILAVLAKSPKSDSSEQKFSHEGSVTESLPNGMFRVRLDNNDLILGYISGKIRKNFVRILPGDRVKIEEVVSAGTDTTTATVEWAMAELLKNKDIMERVREEMRNQDKNKMIDESNISQLLYLQACVKETLRLHPPAPFLLPRRALESCKVMDYTIPKEARIFVNVWAIGRDPSIWEDASSFNPERFMGSDLDFRGQDYEFLPFGGGRRICPGLPMANIQVNLLLATLLHFFDWSLANNEDPSHLDLSGKLGIAMHTEQPLLLIPQRKK